jgi:sugar phosphate isomerase/epimerase
LLGDEFKKTVEFNKILGNKFLIIPGGLDKALETKEGGQMTAFLMNELVDKAAEHGMFVGFHAHGGDVGKVDDTTPWDRLFSQTKKEFVMQVDAGNMLGGGGDPIESLKRYPGRATTVHLKTWGGDRNTVIGDDKVDWPAFFEACETVGGTEWYIVEHETGTNPVESIKGCFEGLRKLGKV